MQPSPHSDDLHDTGRLRIEAWRGGPVDAHGHHPGSAYARRFWLPILGPSAFVAGVMLADGLETSPEGYEVDVASLGLALGLGGRLQRQGKPARTLGRLVRYRLARVDGGATLLYRVRMAWPPLTQRQLDRLPGFLVELHQAA